MGNEHVRFGRRAAETGRQKRRHRAAARPHNLVVDPAFLAVAWARVRGNRGARTVGVDGMTAYYIEDMRGIEPFLADLRADLKAGRFTPLPVRERMTPKPSGKLRRLGIRTVRDRVVQAALKLVLEPIFEADFQPCSHGFRPRHRAQDAIAEIHQLTTPPRNYTSVVDADIEACFDAIDHVSWRWSRRSARPASSAKRRPPRTAIPAHRNAGSCPRCWPTSR
jgi:RNA-directed DNA polymerase